MLPSNLTIVNHLASLDLRTDLLFASFLVGSVVRSIDNMAALESWPTFMLMCRCRLKRRTCSIIVTDCMGAKLCCQEVKVSNCAHPNTATSLLVNIQCLATMRGTFSESIELDAVFKKIACLLPIILCCRYHLKKERREHWVS